jgi:hypothetical protein
MSEYLCRNGHFVNGPVCKICGGKITETDDLDSEDLAEHKNRKNRYYESPEKDQDEDDDL